MTVVTKFKQKGLWVNISCIISRIKIVKSIEFTDREATKLVSPIMAVYYWKLYRKKEALLLHKQRFDKSSNDKFENGKLSPIK